MLCDVTFLEEPLRDLHATPRKLAVSTRRQHARLRYGHPNPDKTSPSIERRTRRQASFSPKYQSNREYRKEPFRFSKLVGRAAAHFRDGRGVGARTTAGAGTHGVKKDEMSCEEFTKAIDRKRQIVEYHVSCLEGLLPGADSRYPIPIPIQAHFEGVVTAVIACTDQIAAGLWQVGNLGRERGGLDATFHDQHAETINRNQNLGALRDIWFSGEMQDIREIRRRASHLYYDKDGSGEHYYVSEYELNREKVLTGGPIRNRELRSFSLVALDLIRTLAPYGIASLRSLH